MQIWTVLFYLCGLAAAAVLLGVLNRPVRTLMRLAANSLLGGLFWLLFNRLAGPFGLHVGLNPVTSVLLGALGLPGALMLLGLSFLL